MPFETFVKDWNQLHFLETSCDAETILQVCQTSSCTRVWARFMAIQRWQFFVNLGLCNLDLFQVSMVYLGPPLDGWKCRHYVVSCCCISTAHTFNRLLIFCYVALSWSSLWRPEMYLTASTRANRLLTGLSDLLLWGGPSCASELLLAPPLVISGGVFTHAQTLQTWVKLLSNEIFQVSSIYVLC